ncbi:hypothetical protein [Pseudovibrio sp. POLY-S9]|uniref:hypothetical protein n=1 Tax=Pseudovibrio sp. POLY-S9 TaxID=1576596 RepID=UPI00070E90A4|nr:hypothetical protein [Pseudovibrio sp. POLY-S9]
MSGAQFAEPRSSQPLDLIAQQASDNGWEGLETLLAPVLGAKDFRPDQIVARHMARIFEDPRGKEILEWILDVSIRLPYKVQGRTLEETALNAARREGINSLAEVILTAIAEGKKLTEEGKT